MVLELLQKLLRNSVSVHHYSIYYSLHSLERISYKSCSFISLQGEIPEDHEIIIFSLTSPMVAKKKTQDTENKIRISVKAFDHKLVDEAVQKIVSTLKDSHVTVV